MPVVEVTLVLGSIAIIAAAPPAYSLGRKAYKKAARKVNIPYLDCLWEKLTDSMSGRHQEIPAQGQEARQAAREAPPATARRGTSRSSECESDFNIFFQFQQQHHFTCHNSHHVETLC